MLNDDYRDMLQNLLDNEVEFLVVGAYALGAHGYPRATGDFDIWVGSGKENSTQVYKALVKFGANLADIDEKTFSRKNIVFQIGLAPRRIDILTSITGVHFNEAFTEKKNIEVDGLKIPFISKANLIKNKSATGRDKDKLDLKHLRKAK